ncbi:hypothetical protein BC835DRAFT_1467027 [Cytidiella melzeri]|nr:hypothetical protein BC835DRAFT_1467027 [Cytidiella melzeri]
MSLRPSLLPEIVGMLRQLQPQCTQSENCPAKQATHQPEPVTTPSATHNLSRGQCLLCRRAFCKQYPSWSPIRMVHSMLHAALDPVAAVCNIYGAAAQAVTPFGLILHGCTVTNKWLDDQTFLNKTSHTISNGPNRSLRKLGSLALDLIAHDRWILMDEWCLWSTQLNVYHAPLSSAPFPSLSLSSRQAHTTIMVRKAIANVVEAFQRSEAYEVDGIPEPVFYAVWLAGCCHHLQTGALQRTSTRSWQHEVPGIRLAFAFAPGFVDEFPPLAYGSTDAYTGYGYTFLHAYAPAMHPRTQSPSYNPSVVGQMLGHYWSYSQTHSEHETTWASTSLHLFDQSVLWRLLIGLHTGIAWCTALSTSHTITRGPC